jgi:hypothetical protein
MPAQSRQSVTITGAGADVTIVKLDPALNDRLVHVLGASVTLSGLTVRDGKGVSSGGGLYLSGARPRSTTAPSSATLPRPPGAGCT